jgi:hypothetical protein
MIDLKLVKRRFALAQRHQEDHHFSGVRRATMEDSLNDIPDLLEEIDRLTTLTKEHK